MGLRCLMGHDFGDVLTQRDREERGDEVVVTVREYRECQRCGDTRTLSENKEVRSAGGGGSAVPEPSAPAPEGSPGDDRFDDVSAEEDDGVILEDEPSTREPGAWPDSDAEEAAETAAGEPTPWPEVEGDDEGFAAEPSDGSPAEGVEFGSGLTPEAAGDPPGDDGGEVVEAAGETGHGGFTRSASTSGGGGQRALTAEMELVCPECEYTAPTRNASLRPGDICPECRLGYLTERER